MITILGRMFLHRPTTVVLPHTSHAQLSTLDSSKQAFDLKLRQAECLLAEEFPDTSTLIRGLRDSKLNKERITSLTPEALMHRRVRRGHLVMPSCVPLRRLSLARFQNTPHRRNLTQSRNSHRWP